MCKRAVAVEAELDVSEAKERSPEWKRVQLLFVRGVHEPGEPEVGKKDWAVFVCTDPALAVSKPPPDSFPRTTRAEVVCGRPYASGVLFGFGRGGGSEMIPLRINQRSIVP